MEGNFSLYEPDNNFYRRGKSRYFWVFLIALALVVFVIVSVIRVQQRDDYKGMDTDITVRWLDVVPERGTIYSADGQMLAVDILRYAMAFDPDAKGLYGEEDSAIFMRNVDSLAGTLSSFFADKPKSAYLKLFKSNFEGRDTIHHNVYFGDRLITAGELEQLRKKDTLMSIDGNKSGIVAEPRFTRIYPNGNIAKRTVGHVRNEIPVVGLEKCLNDVLAGKKGTQKIERVTRLIWRPVYDIKNVEAQNGKDVHTTLDVKLQDFVQEALCNQMSANKAVWGTAIVLDVKTADVKAIANVTYDTLSGKYETENYEGKLYPLQINIEPGSTFKTVSLMSMLDDKDIPLTETFDTRDKNSKNSKSKKIRGVEITDDHSVQVATVQQILELSSNIGIAMIADKYYRDQPGHFENKRRFVENIEKIGIFKPLELDIPISKKPTFRYPGNHANSLTYMDFLKMTHGYVVALTPMHIAVFYNGIANGGVVLNPRFVTHYTNRINHMTTDTFPTKVLNPKMCSDKTLASIKQCLEGVVIRGTASSTVGKSKFRCAGKTGTARLAFDNLGYNGPYIKYYASFVGYFPADNPRYTVLVGMETHLRYKREKQYSGALLSGPVFQQIADYLYDRDKKEQPKVMNPVTSGHKRGVEAAVGNIENLQYTADRMGIKLSVKDEEGIYYAVDSTGTASSVAVSDSLPSLQGFALSDALQLLHGKGYSVTFVGEGTVSRAEYSGKKVKLYLK